MVKTESFLVKIFDKRLDFYQFFTNQVGTDGSKAAVSDILTAHR
jgi:hypothetical protein